jgi:glycosyltransferase involved in cell wall biosynthesis
MIKVTYIISDVNKALAFEWIASGIGKEEYCLSFILLNPGPTILEDFLRSNNFETYLVKCSSKKQWLPALFQTYRLLKKLKPDVVHCHLIKANIIGLTAAKLVGIKKRVYTRHHSSLHHIYFKKGVWLDKYSNRLATHIVAISRVVQRILIDWENVPSNKIILIPHGFLLESFKEVSVERIEGFKSRHSLTNNDFIVGVISRFTEWKGIQYIIPAFKKFLKIKPNAVLLLLNAAGDYEDHIIQLLQEISASTYRLIPFETDIAAAYKAMNVFVHAPVDEHSEAFGQIYVEALAAGVPSVLTLSGIAPEFIQHEENALVVPFKSGDAITQSIIRVMEDKKLASKMVNNGRQKVNELFTLNQMIERLETIYES